MPTYKYICSSQGSHISFHKKIITISCLFPDIFVHVSWLLSCNLWHFQTISVSNSAVWSFIMIHAKVMTFPGKENDPTSFMTFHNFPYFVETPSAVNVHMKTQCLYHIRHNKCLGAYKIIHIDKIQIPHNKLSLSIFEIPLLKTYPFLNQVSIIFHFFHCRDVLVLCFHGFFTLAKLKMQISQQQNLMETCFKVSCISWEI